MRTVAAPTDMTGGNPLRLLLRFAVPLLIGNLFQQFYNVVDSLVVGNFLGTQALAAVGIGDHPVRVLLGLFVGLGTGASIRIAQKVGAGDVKAVRSTIASANVMLLLISIPVTVLGVLVAEPALRAMQTPADTIDQAVTYLRVIFVGTIGLIGYNLNAGILRGLGDSRSSLLFLVVATFVNIGLDLLFVPVLGMGIGGAALATIIAMAVSWGMSLAFLKWRYPAYVGPLWPLRADGEALRGMLRLGLPIGINDALFSFGKLMLSSLVNTHGSVFAAGYNVGAKVDSISFMPIASFASAITTYTGQNIGARRMDRVKEGVRTALIITVVWSVLSCAMMLLFGHQLARLFDAGGGVVDAAYAYILRLEPFYWIYGIMFVLNGVMNGAGETRMPLIANIVLLWVVRLPAAYLLSRLLPPNELFYCYPISWFAGFLITTGYYLTGRWRRHYRKEAEGI